MTHTARQGVLYQSHTRPQPHVCTAPTTCTATPQPPQVLLDEVETVTQRSGLLGGTMLAVQVAGAGSTGGPLLFGGITDAMLASLKQSISDLAT